MNAKIIRKRQFKYYLKKYVAKSESPLACSHFIFLSTAAANTHLSKIKVSCMGSLLKGQSRSHQKSVNQKQEKKVTQKPATSYLFHQLYHVKNKM